MAFGTFLRGFLMGGLLGATGMILVAPQSGQETRSEIRARSQELMHRAEDRYAQVLEKAEHGVANLHTRVDNVMNKSEEGLSTLQTRVDDMLSRGEHAIAETRTRVESDLNP